MQSVRGVQELPDGTLNPNIKVLVHINHLHELFGFFFYVKMFHLAKNRLLETHYKLLQTELHLLIVKKVYRVIPE